ncbi:hypothetical protein [Amycolatopsis sp. NPDC054798]
MADNEGVGEAGKIWGRAVAAGVVAGLAGAVLTGALTTFPWWLAAVAGGACAVMGFWALSAMSRAQLRVARELLGDAVSLRQVRLASRAAEFGRIPADPAVYRLAVEFAERSLRQARKNRLTMTALFACTAAIDLVSLVPGNLGWLWSVAGFGLAAAAAFCGPQLQARRLARLRDNPPPLAR